MKVKFPRTILQAVFITLFFFIVSGFLGFVFKEILLVKTSNNFWLLCAYTFSCITTYILVYKLNGGPLIEVKLRLNNWLNVVYYTIFSCCFFIFFLLPVVKLMSSKKVEFSFLSDNVYWLGALFFGPFIEEVIFRGIILNGLLTRNDSRKSIIISSFLFAIIHVNLTQILVAFTMGLFLGTIYCKTRSILYTVFIHIILNIVISIFSYVNFKYGSNSILEVYGMYTEIMLILSLVVFVFLYIILKKRNLFS